MDQPLVSAETCAAFPIAMCLLFAGLAALGFGWSLILDALNWRRFVRAVGSESAAHTATLLLEAAKGPAR